MGDVSKLPTDFTKALAETITQAETKESSESAAPDLPDDEDKTDRPKEKEEHDEEEEPEEDIEPAQNEKGEENEEEKVPNEDEMSEEDVRKAKIELLQEISQRTSDGFVPVQTPTYDMSLEEIRQIANVQRKEETESIIVGLLGEGYAQLLQLIETLNEKVAFIHDRTPFKFNGAARAVRANMPRLRKPLREIAKRLPVSEKMEKISPFIQLGVVTANILADVHHRNVELEKKQNNSEEERPRPRPKQASVVAAQTQAKAPVTESPPPETILDPLGPQPTIKSPEEILNEMDEKIPEEEAPKAPSFSFVKKAKK